MARGHGRMGTRQRLALIGATSVAVALALAAIAFNAFQAWNIRREAVASIEETMGWQSGDAPLATRTVSLVYLTQDWELEELSYGYESAFDELYEGLYDTYTEMEVELASWCKRHAQTEVARLARLESGTCYVEVFEQEWGGMKWLAVPYVDVSAQYDLIGLTNLALLAIALLGGGVAAFAGWKVGTRLEEASAAQKRFYENMSHELKTPLAAIRGYAEASSAGVVDQGHANAAIVRESERMTRQIDQILSLSRLEAGAVRVHPEDLRVADFVQDCLMPFEGVVRARGLDVQLELGEGSVRADPDLFAHALENLFSNATRHAQDLVWVRYAADVLSVLNDGDLPDAAEVAAMFDRFRAGSSGGTGIGLALTREIATLHGWSVDAALEDGLLCVSLRFV